MEVLKSFYMVHYNFGAVIVLMFLLGIFFAVKKNVKGILILLALIAVINVVVFQKTNNKAWTRDFYATDEYEEKFPLYLKQKLLLIQCNLPLLQLMNVILGL